MTKQTTPQEDQIEAVETDIGDEDYGFIIGPDGELKHLFTPNDFELDPPPRVKKILKILGIDDINGLGFDGEETLH